VTREQGNRLLDAVRDGHSEASERLIMVALVATGDLSACAIVTTFVEEWNELRRSDPLEMAA
jgi:hypothetical protein